VTAAGPPPVLRAGALSPASVDGALRAWGGFLIDVGDGGGAGGGGESIPWRAALAAAHQLFALPRAEKAELAIERSPHFRGYSEMHNQRDWREQLHLGRERPAAGATPAYRRLEGPNLWPSDPAWRRAIAGYADAVGALGEAILGQIVRTLALDADPFAGVGRDGYLVMKLIGYHPQASPDSVRPGVAPHVDFSWLTLTLQDSPGLEVRAPGGGWTLIAPRPGTLWVHAGELLELATGGRYRAAPHRVINQSVERTRVSIPFFLNPPLDAEVPVLAAAAGDGAPADADAGEHVHRVLSPGAPAVPLHFGESEWRRKGLGGWCAVCAPPDEPRG